MKKIKMLIAAIAALTLVSGSVSARRVEALQSAAPVAVVETNVKSTGLDLSTEDSFNFESEDFQKMLEQLQSHIEEMKKKMPAEELAAFDAMENEMKEMGEKLSTLKAELAEFEHQKGLYKKEVVELRDQLAALEKDKVDLQSIIEKLESKAGNTATLDLQESGLEIPAEDELGHQQNVLADVDAQIAQTKQQLEEKRAIKREVKAKVKSYVEEISSLESSREEGSELDFGSFFQSEGDMPAAASDAVFEEPSEEEMIENVLEERVEQPSTDELSGQDVLDAFAADKTDDMPEEIVPEHDELTPEFEQEQNWK